MLALVRRNLTTSVNKCMRVKIEMLSELKTDKRGFNSRYSKIIPTFFMTVSNSTKVTRLSSITRFVSDKNKNIDSYENPDDHLKDL